jgi:hypothetical protein
VECRLLTVIYRVCLRMTLGTTATGPASRPHDRATGPVQDPHQVDHRATCPTQGHRATGGLCVPTARSGFTKTRLHPVAPHPLQPAWRPLRLAWEVESPRGGISHRTSHRTSQIPPHIESPSERPNLPEAMGGDAMPLTRVCGRRPYAPNA